MCIPSQFTSEDYAPCPKQKVSLNAIEQRLIVASEHLHNSVEKLEKTQNILNKISHMSIFSINSDYFRNTK